MKPLRMIDDYLNNITMYRLLVYGLGGLLGGAVALGFTNRLSISAPAILASLAVLLVSCSIANRCLAILWEAASNTESWLITALILCLILPPSTALHHLALIGLAGVLAMASKYVLAYRHKHLFNPAALAALVLGLSKLLPAIWWIGSPALLPLTVIFGLLILRKLHRFPLFLSFLVASLVVSVLVGRMHGQALESILVTAFKSGPLVFLGTVMLTEPATAPPLVWQQRIYGALVGIIFSCQLRLGFVSATPELALIAGNIYAYIVSPKYKLRLRFKAKQQLAPHVYDLAFISDSAIDFKPGQYLEWTLLHPKTDSRGNRRVFSIASAPGEAELHIGIKTSQPGSSFKRALLALEPGDAVTAGQLAGHFVLPKNTNRKLVFIAGGIGVTPFVSMVKAMIKAQEQRDIVLFYLVSSQADYCYDALWQAAAAFGVRVVPVVTNEKPDAGWQGLYGRLTEVMLCHAVPDYRERTYYLSGPNALVQAYSDLLRQSGITRRALVTDYFSGY